MNAATQTIDQAALETQQHHTKEQTTVDLRELTPLINYLSGFEQDVTNLLLTPNSFTSSAGVDLLNESIGVIEGIVKLHAGLTQQVGSYITDWSKFNQLSDEQKPTVMVDVLTLHIIVDHTVPWPIRRETYLLYTSGAHQAHEIRTLAKLQAITQKYGIKLPCDETKTWAQKLMAWFKAF